MLRYMCKYDIPVITFKILYILSLDDEAKEYNPWEVTPQLRIKKQN